MSVRQEFNDLIEQLTYLDHELNRDVAGELTEVISHARGEGLRADEILELVRSRAETMKFRGQLDDPEQQELVDQLIQQLPDVLAAS